MAESAAEIDHPGIKGGSWGEFRSIRGGVWYPFGGLPSGFQVHAFRIALVTVARQIRSGSENFGWAPRLVGVFLLILEY